MKRIQKKGKKFYQGTLKNEDNKLKWIQKKRNKILPSNPWIRIFENKDNKLNRIKKKGSYIRILKNYDPDEGQENQETKGSGSSKFEIIRS